MAKVKDNILLNGVSGKLGNIVIRHMVDGSTRICKKPNFSERKFSQGQKDHQERFRNATDYARGAAKTQPIYAELAKGTTKNAYNWALSDWFKPPVIHRIERQEGKIRVRASDNVKVTKVRIQVLDSDGNVLEQGEAEQLNATWWEFALTTDGTVVATAWDLAGNEVEAIL
jgi:hypothetical protein